MTYSPPIPPPTPVSTWGVTRPAPDPSALPLRADSNIQGNVIAAFNKDYQVLLFIAWTDLASARAWLTATLPRLATSQQVASFNARFSAARRSSGADPEALFALWSNLSLTAAGVGLLAPDAIADLHAHAPLEGGLQAWLDGAANSSVAGRVGDAGLSEPSTWIFGGTSAPIHAVVCIAADRPSDLDIELAHHRQLAAANQVSIVFEQPGQTQSGAAAGHEHFGFKDGISQPGVLGFDPQSTDPAHSGEVDGKPGTDLIAAGTFVLGYPRDTDPGVQVPEWMFDGSFLVTRRLAQDVPGFWASVEVQHKTLTGSAVTDPATGIPTPDALGAKLVGRWRSGTPTDHAPVFDNRSAQDPTLDNAFDFEDDQAGTRTPACAHIRKVYPRQGATQSGVPPLTEDQTKIHRILRRGIPFGQPFAPGYGRGDGVDATRGLVFQCYQASLEDQFIFLQQAWVNDAGFPAPNIGPDPVIGSGGAISIPAGGSPQTLTFADFVNTEGSIFALTPSLPTLRLLAAGTDLPTH